MTSSTTAVGLLAVRPGRRGGVSTTRLLDGAVAAGALAVSLALSSRHVGSLRPGPHVVDAAGVVLAAASTLPLTAWRRSPRGVFVLTASMSVLLGGLGYSIGLMVGPTVALYLWAASRESARPWTRRDTAMVVALFGAALVASAVGDRGFPGIELLHSGLAFAVAWFAGERTRLRRDHIADLEERARRTQHERESDRRLALAEERGRIARDLHDSVGHALNVIVVRAGAARMRHDREPDRSRAALQAIEDIARETAAEIDHLVGTLRDPAVDRAGSRAPLGLVSLPTLVAEHAANGLEVDLTECGAPRDLDPAVDLATYRILQEALTNAARHGRGRVRVELAYRPKLLEITVTNRISERAAAGSTGGHGLIGMRERATILGGSFDVARDDETFRLSVRFPYRSRVS